jgi:hypothetical protein
LIKSSHLQAVDRSKVEKEPLFFEDVEGDTHEGPSDDFVPTLESKKRPTTGIKGASTCDNVIDTNSSGIELDVRCLPLVN